MASKVQHLIAYAVVSGSRKPLYINPSQVMLLLSTHEDEINAGTRPDAAFCVDGTRRNELKAIPNSQKTSNPALYAGLDRAFAARAEVLATTWSGRTSAGAGAAEVLPDGVAPYTGDCAGEDLVGKEVLIFWGGDKTWYRDQPRDPSPLPHLCTVRSQY